MHHRRRENPAKPTGLMIRRREGREERAYLRHWCKSFIASSSAVVCETDRDRVFGGFGRVICVNNHVHTSCIFTQIATRGSISTVGAVAYRRHRLSPRVETGRCPPEAARNLLFTSAAQDLHRGICERGISYCPRGARRCWVRPRCQCQCCSRRCLPLACFHLSHLGLTLLLSPHWHHLCHPWLASCAILHGCSAPGA